MNGPRGLDFGRIWVVGCIADAATLRRVASEGAPGCGAVEVRLDLPGVAEPGWLEACRKIRKDGLRVLLTLRQRREGGAWAGRAAARWALLENALESGAADAVDWEIHAAGTAEMTERLRELGGPAAWVASWHRFSNPCSARRLAEETLRAARAGARWIKLAVMADTPADWSRLARAWSELPNLLPAGCPLPTLLPMGAEGGKHRAELAKPGRGALLFGSLGTPTAPGQPTASSLSASLGS